MLGGLNPCPNEDSFFHLCSILASITDFPLNHRVSTGLIKSDHHAMKAKILGSILIRPINYIPFPDGYVLLITKRLVMEQWIIRCRLITITILTSFAGIALIA